MASEFYLLDMAITFFHPWSQIPSYIRVCLGSGPMSYGRLLLKAYWLLCSQVMCLCTLLLLFTKDIVSRTWIPSLSSRNINEMPSSLGYTRERISVAWLVSSFLLLLIMLWEKQVCFLLHVLGRKTGLYHDYVGTLLKLSIYTRGSIIWASTNSMSFWRLSWLNEAIFMPLKPTKVISKCRMILLKLRIISYVCEHVYLLISYNPQRIFKSLININLVAPTSRQLWLENLLMSSRSLCSLFPWGYLICISSHTICICCRTQQHLKEANDCEDD